MRLVKNQLELFSFASSLHPLATTALNFQHPHKHSHCSSFYSFEPVKLENSKSDQYDQALFVSVVVLVSAY